MSDDWQSAQFSTTVQRSATVAISSRHPTPRLVRPTFPGDADVAPGRGGAATAVIGQCLGDRSEHLASMANAMHWHVCKSACDSGFNGAGRRRNETLRGGLRIQPDSSSISPIALASKQTFSEESLEDSRDRARMQVGDPRDLSSGETRMFRYDSNDQPLWSGNPESRLHSLGRALEPMLDVPQETHEVQNWIQVQRPGRFRR
jgi:hypothetical protein